jgi:hypothetical protein
MLPAGVQTIRFRKPTTGSDASKAADSSEKLKAGRHVVVKDTLIAEQINRLAVMSMMMMNPFLSA